MKNMTMHQAKAMAIQVPSTRSSGCFHHSRSAGGRIALMDVPLYLANGMVRMSITPQSVYTTIGIRTPRNSSRNGLSSSCCVNGTGPVSSSSWLMSVSSFRKVYGACMLSCAVFAGLDLTQVVHCTQREAAWMLVSRRISMRGMLVDDRRMASLRKVAFACAALVLAITTLSAFIRLSAGGLGCEPWPRCYVEAAQATQPGNAAPATAAVAAARIAHRITAVA